MVLEKIQKENDIKKLTPEELELLKDEIRQFLIESISVTGGHLASNLGVVELTMALHLCFDLPKDKIVWDVGHQSYTHKILTGRKDGFSSLRQYGGMSGFPKADESDCDCFNTGHSSTSISAGLGLATARQVTGEDYHVVFLDPYTGAPSESDVVSTTIIADSGTDCDALSTATFLLGAEDGMALINSLDGVEAVFIQSDGTMVSSDHIDSYNLQVIGS